MDVNQILLFLGAAAIIGLMAWRGWRLGLIRQLISLFALAAAYAAAFFGGHYLIPVLRPLGFPDRILAILGGVILGTLVFVGISIVSGILFKKTAHQSVGAVRFGFGLSGAIVGGAFGLFLVLVAAISIRLLGSIAESEAARSAEASVQPPAVVSGLANLKHSLEQGASGAVIDTVDPVPNGFYTLLGKVGQLTGSPESVERFIDDPKVKKISVHPKILALQEDPDVIKAVRDGDYISLLRNPKLVEAANDPDVMTLIGGFDLEKTLDNALTSPEKPAER